MEGGGWAVDARSWWDLVGLRLVAGTETDGWD